MKLLNDMSRRDIAIKLLYMCQDYSEGIEKIESVGLEFPEFLKLDFYEVVLDLLGVPEENRLQSYREQGICVDKVQYCRDWLWDIDMKINAKKIVKYIEEQMQEHNETEIGENNGLL